jgi:hypothetical protein
MADASQAAFADQKKDLSAPALRFYDRITSLWGLSVAQKRVLLGGVAESTYFKYVKDPDSAKLSRDTLDRISHIIGIYKAINILLPRPEAANAWITKPNAALGGEPALDVMLRGGFEDLAFVRRYLDGVRGH